MLLGLSQALLQAGNDLTAPPQLLLHLLLSLLMTTLLRHMGKLFHGRRREREGVIEGKEEREREERERRGEEIYIYYSLIL